MAVTDIWGPRTPYKRAQMWPRRVDTELAAGTTSDDVDCWVPTASVLHSNGGGLEIAVRRGRIVGIRGRADDRINRGRLDVKDRYGWKANASPDRLSTPMVRKDGELVPTDWDTAMSRIAEHAEDLLNSSGPSSIGFYTSGQLFLEEYYALSVIARAGIGTNHLDGNTRLCTATAGEALKESFGSDGQPGTLADVDHADVIALFGHNVAETQSVTWMRILDRLAAPDPPKLLCVDPRTTAVARRASVHLAPLPGTNLALMNGLLRELVVNGWIDDEFIREHTVGFEDLSDLVSQYPPERVSDICGVGADDIRHGARLIGEAQRLLSTVLQGFYQSHQATASAVQVNNIHLLRGMLGRPGCGVLQMNGQPTAQNTRECGADGDLAGFRNWANPAHVRELASVWNVDAATIPHFAPPTHAMQIFRYAEQESLKMLWVSATNPAVSMPELRRVRSILSKESLFLVVQDIFLTETGMLADVVLPAAAWGEKVGTFTNADRTVHLSEKAVDPPGGARADLDIFLDFSRRMDFRDRDGRPLTPWSNAEAVFEAWKRCSAGRLCDYSGMSYAGLREQGSVQWPCTDTAPGGTARLYADGRFWTAADECETYGKDLITGSPVDATRYRANDPKGRALIKSADYETPHEPPSAQYPFALITGRTVYHFHTRTKTARAPELNGAAPEVWVELSAADAATHGIRDGDPVEIRSPRSTVRAAARIADIRPGVLFLPFHYGYWDVESPAAHDRAANELTLTDWDPASKQPIFKTAAAAIALLSRESEGTR